MTSTEDRLRAEVSALDSDMQSGEYFRVVVLAPQLLVRIVDVLSKYTDEYLRRKGLLTESLEDTRVQDAMRRLHKSESDRLTIANALEAFYEGSKTKTPDARADFERSFTLLEALVSMRNRLAHDYYAKPATMRSLKICAAGGIELLQLFERELL